MPIRNNFFTNSRVRNPWAGVQFGMGNREPEPEEQSSISNISRRYLQPQNPALDSFNQHVSGMPNEADYSPSIWRRILAGVAGASTGYDTRDPMKAFEAAEHINRSPYRNAIDQWGRKGEALESAARLENTSGNLGARYLGLENTDRYNTGRINNSAEGNAIDRIDAATRAHNARTAEKRADFALKIANAADDTDREQLKAQKARWEVMAKNEGDELAIARQRANSYATAVNTNAANSNRNLNRPPTKAQREVAIDQIVNENPTQWLGADGKIKQELLPMLEVEINRRLGNVRNIDINLPAMGNITGGDASDWVLEP